MSLIIKARAKINLHLKVIRRRPDGWHDLETIMVPVSLADRITLDPAPAGEVTLACDGAAVTDGPDNLALRAARAFGRAWGREIGARIHIRKRIPVAAGLGGGSSDAAAVLWGLNLLAGGPLDQAALMAAGRELGADVPFFLGQGPALAEGLGDRLTPLEKFGRPWLLLVHPPLSVSTAEVYDRLAAPLTSRPGCSIFIRLKSGRENLFRVDDSGDRSAVSVKGSPESLDELLVNDLASVTEARHPVVGRIRAELKASGALGAMMSGSGPT
ncbi:MAG: 4-(cytidine 5'-diphospho)-2-C-methyl-D-erythritol kinase, partial [Proteobacteria bacterium]|nr:4-(cytidine 5'-diphospho)-2-C-methyl-D-erythritol kinase [Pseudomonadota bacterium]